MFPMDIKNLRETQDDKTRKKLKRENKKMLRELKKEKSLSALWGI